MAGALDIAGTGGFARQILPLVEDLPGTTCRFFADGGTGAGNSGLFADYCVLPLAAYDGRNPFIVAIGDRAARHAVAQRMAAAGGQAGSLIAPSARVSRHARIAPGAIVCDFAVIEPEATIGLHFQANVRAFVAHECIVGDFVTIGPGAICNGNVAIGDHAYIGAGAILRQGHRDRPLTIGVGATVGMGAVVTKDVPAHAVVAGNPARPLRTPDD
ncbi:MAG: NeuD/PglB/VioB family sugar acetyltransferase [Sphingomonadales bacterium]|nr:NeuD/PglB/VioB family sugar acetyltransferase [Sphingomonadales bacterium]MBD3775137.1 NeuD/PglB/VioB family sugar acetyltransferase [Paracoccaceae bacterium]